MFSSSQMIPLIRDFNCGAVCGSSSSFPQQDSFLFCTPLHLYLTEACGPWQNTDIQILEPKCSFASVFCSIFINHQCLAPFYMFNQQLKHLNVLRCFEWKYIWVFRNWLYVWLWTTVWMLGLESGSAARTRNGLILLSQLCRLSYNPCSQWAFFHENSWACFEDWNRR